MSEKGEKDQVERQSVAKEPEPGTGVRSLTNWQNLARVRQSLSADTANAQQFKSDPAAYMQRFGVDVVSVGGAGGPDALSLAPQQVGVESMMGENDTQLAFCKVWGCAIVVAGVAAVAAANVSLLANALGAANAVGVANAAMRTNVNVFGSGDGSYWLSSDTEGKDGGATD
jgi:hypothetical protein